MPSATRAPKPLTIHFWSSTEYSGFLEELCQELSAGGTYQARQRFLISEEAYRSARSLPARLWLRAKQYVFYPIYLCSSLVFGKRADIVVVCTNTFYAPYLATFCHKRVLHLLYDLFPEALIHARKQTELGRPARENTEQIVDRIVRKMVYQTLKRASANVFLGPRLRAYVEEQYGPLDNAFVIEVGSASPGRQQGAGSGGEPGQDARDVRMSAATSNVERQSEHSGEGHPKGGAQRQTFNHGNALSAVRTLRLLYCGNMGHMHDVDTLAEGLRRVAAQCSERLAVRSSKEVRRDTAGPGASSPDDAAACDMQSETTHTLTSNHGKAVQLRFHSSGAGYAALQETLGDLAAFPFASFHGGLDTAAWADAMAWADIGLVTMKPGAEQVVMPSKTYSAMMAGQAILAIAPQHSDLVDLIKTADCGWHIEPGDIEGLVKILNHLPHDVDEVALKQTNAQDYAERHLSQKVLAEKWCKLFATLTQE